MRRRAFITLSAALRQRGRLRRPRSNPIASDAILFNAPLVVLPDTSGVRHRVDHLQRLKEAERRISRALAKAREQRR
jgi:hypothetical protein